MVNFVVEVVVFFVFEVKFVVEASFVIEVKFVEVASFVIEAKMVEAFLLLLPPLIFFVSKRQSLKTLLARIQEQ